MPSVQFKINGVNFGSPVTQPPYSVQWTPSSGGSYTVTYEVTNTDGTKKTSKPKAVTVKSVVVTPPTLGTQANLLGINIPAMGDYLAPYFRDAARQCRPYEAIDGGVVAKDANGYPTVANFQVYIWAGGYRRHGTYAVTITHPASYGGGGTLSSLGGTISNVVYNATTQKTTATWTHVEAGESVGMLKFQNFTGGITHLKVMRPSSAGSSTPYDESKIFMDSMIDVIGLFDGARLLDTTGVNSSGIRTWSERTLITDYSQARDQGEPGSGFGFAGRGLAWEYVADLANEVKSRQPSFKAIWINVPVLADDNFVTQLFTLLKNRLSPDILIQCEMGNENWNFAPAFIHAAYNRDEAVLEAAQPGSPLSYDGDTGQYTVAWRRQALRTVQYYAIAQAVWGADVDNKIQFQLQWQQQNGQNTAGTLLKFIDKGLNALATVAKFGLGGSWYYNPVHDDPTLTIDNIWDNNTMNPTVWATNWLQKDVHWVVAYGAPTGLTQWNSYEGGPSFDAVNADGDTTQTVANRNNGIMKAANYDSRMAADLIEHVDVRSQHGGNWAYCYKLGGAHDNQYEWAFLFDHDNFNTPKMAGIATLRGRNRAALTYGRLAPFTINAGLYDINDRGYGEPSNGDYRMDGTETVSYTFRIATAGTYRFSFQPTSNGTFRTYLGTTVLTNSVTLAANTYSTPVNFSCPNPGLYSARVRNLLTDQATLKEVKIEAV
jgi:hypothetical protein